MKRWIAAALLILTAVLAGCSAQVEYPQAIMVNDVIYYSTGELLPVEMDPESMAGFVTSCVYGLPEENGQANFDDALGKAYAICQDAEGNEGVAMDMNGGWLFFRAEEPET